MQQCGIFNDIESALNRLKYHAKSLLKNMTNNNAETFNSVVAKFVGGKRINYSLRGGYQMRCFASALSYNSRGEYLRILNSTLGKGKIGFYNKKYVKAAVNRRNTRKKYKKRNIVRRQPQEEPDKDYGPHAEQPQIEMDPAEFVIEKTKFLQGLKKTSAEIQTICEQTKDQSANGVWMAERNKRLTASNFGKICKLRAKTDRTKTAEYMVSSQFKGNKATMYGIENEPKALKQLNVIIQKEEGERIVSCGLVIHPIHSFLGASPDGLVGSWGCVEIKCPYKARNKDLREAIRLKEIDFCELIDEKLHLKRTHTYYYQVQGQLFVTGRDYCFFAVYASGQLLLEKIKKDENFCSNMLPKLTIFYAEHLLTAIIKREYSNNSNSKENM